MNFVDALGWIEYIAEVASADFFEPAIVASENLFVPTICLYEVFKRVLQEFWGRTCIECHENRGAGHDH